MLTIDTLRQFGANTEEGLRRCMGSEALYLRLVVMALEDPGFDRLTAAVEADDRRSAFQAVHAIKGVMANLALTPLFEACSVMTELLRADEDADYHACLEQILRKRRSLLALRDA